MAKGRDRGLEAELKRKITALAEELAAEIIDIAAAAIKKSLSGGGTEIPSPPPQVRPVSAGPNGANGVRPPASNGTVRRSDIFFG
jgi:hypothetical protein